MDSKTEIFLIGASGLAVLAVLFLSRRNNVTVETPGQAPSIVNNLSGFGLPPAAPSEVINYSGSSLGFGADTLPPLDYSASPYAYLNAVKPAYLPTLTSPENSGSQYGDIAVTKTQTSPCGCANDAL